MKRTMDPFMECTGFFYFSVFVIFLLIIIIVPPYFIPLKVI
jgi:hypothetical protein